MTTLATLPVIIPLAAASLALLARRSLAAQRFIGLAAVAASAVVAIWLVFAVDASGAIVVELGEWSAPIGISLVADRLAVLMPCWPEPERGESPFEAAARSETERRLEAALARLPLRDREVLLLVGVEGLTPSTAATVCGVTPQALRKRLQRARERLAAEMAEPAVSARRKAG